MKYISNKLILLWERVVKGFRYAVRKQLQLVLRFMCAFVLMAILMFFCRPKSVEFEITPEFKIIDGQYKTTLWKNGYYEAICSRDRNEIGVFWTQQCILSNLELPQMKSNQIRVAISQLQYQSINTVRLCRHIKSIDKSICEERYVKNQQVEIIEVNLNDVMFLSVSLRLKDKQAYFTNPTINIHTDPSIIVLLIHRFYYLFLLFMSSIFALIVSLCLIVKDIYYYSESNQGKEIDNQSKKKKK